MKVIESDKVAPLFRLLLMNNQCADAIIHDVQEIVDSQSVDPIHAAGGCYCGECKNRNEKYLQGEGSLYCHITHNRVEPTHFCGDGKRENNNPCGNCMSGSYRGCNGCSYSEKS